MKRETKNKKVISLLSLCAVHHLCEFFFIFILLMFRAYLVFLCICFEYNIVRTCKKMEEKNKRKAGCEK